MKQLIDKFAVAAEIEKRLHKYEQEYEELAHYEIWGTAIKIRPKIEELKNLLSFINTIETKEVDLEKEISDYLTSYHLHIKDGGRVVFDNNDSPNFMCDIRHIAKHFFEVGLKTQKGE